LFKAGACGKPASQKSRWGKREYTL
jgi:hypothetical protein